MDVIGIGVDIVDVARIERLVDEDRAFVTRVFSSDEISQCEGASRPAECYAARWAAREACAKALGGIPEGRWRDIRVVRRDERPEIELDGVARERAEQLGARRILVSFSHEHDHAVACCLALGGDGP
jgi:holo-[acyl-carrier protein] synthase